MRSGGGNNEGAGGQSGLKKGPWTPAEDMILMEYVRKHGEGNWNAVQKNSDLSRCGKSCRLRWANHLRPNLKKGAFSPEEELLILRLHAQLGNKWARMAAHLPGRTDNEIKNYWNTRIKRRQRAGLPLYPSDIQRQAAAAHGAQTHHMSPATPPPLSPVSPPTTTHFSATPLSLLDPTGLSSQFSRHHHHHHHLPMSNSVTELPQIKRLRNDHNHTHLGFQLSFASSHPPPLYQPQPQQAFQYNMGSFDLGGPVAPQPRFPMKLELPSTQLFPESSDSPGGGLLDAMLQETTTTDMAAGRDGLLSSTEDHQDTKWVQLVTGDGDNAASGESAQGETEELAGKCDNQEHTTEKKMIKNESAQENNNPMSEELSALLDMIPATTTTEWCNRDSGGPSSVITDEDMGLDMQQLATSMSMGHEEQEWNLESCPWSPGIC